jgi:DNA-binding response OmpR family regulator
MRSNASTALLISPVEQDHDFLRSLFDDGGWTLYSALSLPSGSRLLREKVAPLVITEANLPIGTWRNVLEVTGLLKDTPLVIVTSIHADERLWVEALNLGAHDVLAKPFDKAEVIRVLTYAWSRTQPPRLRSRSVGA